jgi:hypothetical protein
MAARPRIARYLISLHILIGDTAPIDGGCCQSAAQLQGWHATILEPGGHRLSTPVRSPEPYVIRASLPPYCFRPRWGTVGVLLLDAGAGPALGKWLLKIPGRLYRREAGKRLGLCGRRCRDRLVGEPPI